MLANRFPENPLITPADVNPSRQGFTVIGAFNPAAVEFNGEILLMLRVAEQPESLPKNESVAVLLDYPTGRLVEKRFHDTDEHLEKLDAGCFRYCGELYTTSISHLRLARSRDGRHFTVDPQPAVFPREEYETYGIEDPRITRIGSEFYIAYKGVSKQGIVICLLRTADFKHYERMGIIFPPENMDAVLFPELIGGRYYALTRPVGHCMGGKAMWVASSPNLTDWGKHRLLIPPGQTPFAAGGLGAGCVPIKTPHGWLELYHGHDTKRRYCMGAVLLDLHDPARIIALGTEPIMTPKEEYEIKGFIGNTVFACGAIEGVDGDLTIFYGAGDECVAGATMNINEILKHLGVA